MGKHEFKGWLRSAFAGCVWHTGMWRLFHRLSRRRLVILAGHCVGQGSGLPADMTLSPDRLRTIIAALSKGFDWETVGAGVQAIDATRKGRSLAALSFDDGYRDNHDVLLPILEESGARATVFLEGRPLTERQVSWSHKYFWLIHVAGLTPGQIANELVQGEPSGLPLQELKKAGADAERSEYLVKRVLKYECDAPLRDLVLRRLFVKHRGDEASLCASLYMDAAMARAMQAAQVELGGHTFSHEVLASLDAQNAAQEIERGRDALQAVLEKPLSTSFAYPYGRRWDFRPEDQEAVAAAGYALAVTTHPGVYVGRAASETDIMSLPRIMVEETTPISHILCEACGAFRWLRRLGLDLTE